MREPRFTAFDHHGLARNLLDEKAAYEGLLYELGAVRTQLFGEEGLSMSEAQFLAEKASQLERSRNRSFEGTGPYHKVMVWEGGRDVVLEAPTPVDLLEAIEIGGFYALTAYLKEAIKDKAKWLRGVELLPLFHFVEPEEALGAPPVRREQEKPAPGIYPDRPEFREPTENDVLREISPEETAEYLRIEAEVATLGRLIHPGGAIYEIANAIPGTRFETYTMNDGAGKKDFPVEVNPAYDLDKAMEAYVVLHDGHREKERKLNYLKASRKNRLAELRQEAVTAHQEEIAAHEAELSRIAAEEQARFEAYQNEREAARLEFESALSKHQADQARLRATARARQVAETSRVSALKVVIPSTLSETLTYVRDFKGVAEK